MPDGPNPQHLGAVKGGIFLDQRSVVLVRHAALLATFFSNSRTLQCVSFS